MFHAWAEVLTSVCLRWYAFRSCQEATSWHDFTASLPSEASCVGVRSSGLWLLS